MARAAIARPVTNTPEAPACRQRPNRKVDVAAMLTTEEMESPTVATTPTLQAAATCKNQIVINKTLVIVLKRLSTTTRVGTKTR